MTPNPLMESYRLIKLLHRVGTVSLIREAKFQLDSPDEMFSRVMDELEHREALERRALDERWAGIRSLRLSKAGRSDPSGRALEGIPW
jgi:hypothetical protein